MSEHGTGHEAPENQTCPRCGFVTADPFNCPTCKARDNGEIEPMFRSGSPADYGEARRIVEEQAEDEALWFDAVTITEAYLQQALRSLHAAVERSTGGETGPLAGGAAEPAE